MSSGAFSVRLRMAVAVFAILVSPAFWLFGQQPLTTKACSEGSLSEKQEEFVPIELNDLGSPKASSVSVLELTQQTPPEAKKALQKGFKALRHSRIADGQGFLIEALTIDPKYFQASTLLAGLLFNTKEFAAARMYAERARAINPDYPQAIEILGALDVLDGQWPRAISELTEFVRNSPLRKAAHYYLGIACLHLGRCEEGSRHLETVAFLSAHPSTPRDRMQDPENSTAAPGFSRHPIWRDCRQAARSTPCP